MFPIFEKYFYLPSTSTFDSARNKYCRSGFRAQSVIGVNGEKGFKKNSLHSVMYNITFEIT